MIPVPIPRLCVHCTRAATLREVDPQLGLATYVCPNGHVFLSDVTKALAQKTQAAA